MGIEIPCKTCKKRDTCREKCYYYAIYEQDKLIASIAAIQRGEGKLLIGSDCSEDYISELLNAESEEKVNEGPFYMVLYESEEGWRVPMPLIIKVNLPVAKKAYSDLPRNYRCATEYISPFGFSVPACAKDC